MFCLIYFSLQVPLVGCEKLKREIFFCKGVKCGGGAMTKLFKALSDVGPFEND